MDDPAVVVLGKYILWRVARRAIVVGRTYRVTVPKMKDALGNVAPAPERTRVFPGSGGDAACSGASTTLLGMLERTLHAEAAASVRIEHSRTPMETLGRPPASEA